MTKLSCHDGDIDDVPRHPRASPLERFRVLALNFDATSAKRLKG